MGRHFYFEIRETDGKLNFKSEGEGFSTFEVLGFLEFKRDDILNQIKGTVKPDVISRTRIVDEAPEV